MAHRHHLVQPLALLAITTAVHAQPMAAPGPVHPLSKKEVGVLIDSLGKALERTYIYPDAAARMVSALKEQYKKGAYNSIPDKGELAMRLRSDLQHVQPDEHLLVRYDPRQAEALHRNLTEAEQALEREQELAGARADNFSFRKAELLQGNIGYLRWDEFVGAVDAAMPTVDAAFRFVSNADAVVIDLRYNGGGSPEMVLRMQDYFFDKATQMNDIIDRWNDTTKRVTDPGHTTFKLAMPIYVLTSHRTFSGAEDFAYGLQQAHRAVLVGDTTGGGAHPTGTYDIGQGFVAMIPFARAPEGKDWEGIGVRPDVAISSEASLVKAQALVFTDHMAKAQDDRERKMYQWQLDRLSAGTTAAPDSTQLRAYTGVYEGGMDFHLVNGVLYCRNEENGGLLTALQHIRGDLFVLDDIVQVEFMKDDTGAYSRLIMHWKFGVDSGKRKI